MKAMKHDDTARADLSALLSRTIAATPGGQSASGIDVVEFVPTEPPAEFDDEPIDIPEVPEEAK